MANELETTTAPDTAPDFTIPKFKSALEPATPFTPEQLAQRYRQTATIGYVEELVKDRVAKTRHDLTYLVDKTVDIIYESVGKIFMKQKAQFAEIERRLAALEAQPTSKGAGVTWAGIYRAGNTYDEGQLVTHAGGLWLARRDTDSKPGSEAWTLVVKRGEYER
jgi:hypothetical protein